MNLFQSQHGTKKKMRQIKMENVLLAIMAIIAVLAMWTTGIVLLLGMAIRAI